MKTFTLDYTTYLLFLTTTYLINFWYMPISHNIFLNKFSFETYRMERKLALNSPESFRNFLKLSCIFIKNVQQLVHCYV